jgi:hypothetical protein
VADDDFYKDGLTEEREEELKLPIHWAIGHVETLLDEAITRSLGSFLVLGCSRRQAIMLIKEAFDRTLGDNV